MESVESVYTGIKWSDYTKGKTEEEIIRTILSLEPEDALVLWFAKLRGE